VAAVVVTFALAMATISSYVSEGGATWIMPLLLLALLALSYVMRPPNRRLTGTVEMVESQSGV